MKAKKSANESEETLNAETAKDAETLGNFSRC